VIASHGSQAALSLCEVRAFSTPEAMPVLGPVPAAGGWTGQQRLKLSNLAIDGKMMHLQLAHVEIANSAAISVGEGYSPPLPLSPSRRPPPPAPCLLHAHARARTLGPPHCPRSSDHAVAGQCRTR
jgi:hypothetical protein